MDLIKNKHLGYNRDNVIYFEREGALLGKDNQPFLDALKQQPGVQNAAVSGFMVGGGNSTGGVSWPGKTPDDQIQFWETKSGNGLLDLLEIKIVEGRDFSDDFPSDTAAIIFNEAAIQAMGLEDPIGTVVNHYRGEKKIIGVVKDFNLISLHTAVEPMLFWYEPNSTHFVMVKLESSRVLEGLQNVGEVYESFNQGYLYEPSFVDDDYQAMYVAEERVSVLSKYFAGFAVLITCLGLFGLASFTMERRTKEIGVRKILGSTDLGIVKLLSSEFSVLMLVAMIFSIPLSYLVSNLWLDNFAYQIDLSWWIFVLGPLLIVLVSAVTVFTQSIRAASTNPVESLRDH